MAIRAITIAEFVPVQTRSNFLSPPIKRPHRPIAIVLFSNFPYGDSRWNVFLTKSDTPIATPQPGDPDAFIILDLQAVQTVRTVIPLTTTATIEANVRLAVSFYNNRIDSPDYIVATYIYEEM